MANSGELFSLYLQLLDELHWISEAQFLVELSSFVLDGSPFNQKRYGTPVEQGLFLLLVYESRMEYHLETLRVLLERLGERLRSCSDGGINDVDE